MAARGGTGGVGGDSKETRGGFRALRWLEGFRIENYKTVFRYRSEPPTIED
jgi:hypothetical protein